MATRAPSELIRMNRASLRLIRNHSGKPVDAKMDEFSEIDQAPAVYRDQIPIPGFLKIKYRDFSGFRYSILDNVFKYV